MAAMETVVAVRPGVRAFRNAAEAIQIQLPLKGGELGVPKVTGQNIANESL
jgi:hypothetical protein